MSYGFTCYGCKTMLETPFKDARPAEEFASERGWKIGHFNGQGYIMCGDCEGAVWDAQPLAAQQEPTPDEESGGE